MTRTWQPLQNDRYFAKECEKSGIKIEAVDTEDSYGPAYYAFATEQELDRIWSMINH